MRLDFSRMRWGRISPVLNPLLAIAAFAMLVNLFMAWRGPLLPDVTAESRPSKGIEAKAPARPFSYRVIADRDIFRPERQKPAPSPKKAQKAEPPPPPPRKAPPVLKLVGTVLLDKSEAAIIDAGGMGPAYYRVGDSIEEFVIKSIQKDAVMLERDDGMVLTAGSKPAAASAPGGTRPALHQPLLSGNGKNDARSDMPPALIPKKSALMAP